MQKVSKRQCDQMMREIIPRMDQYKNVERPTCQDFLEAIQEDLEKNRTLDFLESKGYISCIRNQVSGNLLRIHIEKPGIAYFEDIAEASRTKRIEWIRYIVTTGIAVAALITAIVSIILQYR